MDSTKFALSLMFVTALFMMGCQPPNMSQSADENKVGTPLSQLNSLYVQNGQPKSTITVYDTFVHKIHQFNLTDMTLIHSHDVENPTIKHYPVSNDSGRYLADLSTSSLRILSAKGKVLFRTNFVGTPVSAAFRSDLGLLAVYDNLNNLSILSLDESGNVLNYVRLGSRLPADATIAAGDIVGDGLLALALSDNSIEFYDINAMLSGQSWPAPKYSLASGLSGIKWLAPVHSNPNVVLVYAPGTVALFNYTLASQNQIDSMDTGSLTIEKYSKNYDAHLILTDSWENKTLVYPDPDGNHLSKVTKFQQFGSILSSDLNLADDTWTFSATTLPSDNPIYNDGEADSSGRTLVRYGFSTMAALAEKPLPDEAQISMAKNYIFALFPSELGYAVRYDVEDDGQAEAKLFNMSQY